jgi:hypothetical protein
MIALENLKKVDVENNTKVNSVRNWNWVPKVSNIKDVERVFEASLQTSRPTGSSQTDHGEAW